MKITVTLDGVPIDVKIIDTSPYVYLIQVSGYKDPVWLSQPLRPPYTCVNIDLELVSIPNPKDWEAPFWVKTRTESFHRY